MHPETALEKKALETIERYGMLSPGDTVVVSVSGGPDSLALLNFLAALAPELRLTLLVFHLDHMIRGAQSASDAEFVAAEAGRMGLDSRVEAVEVRAAPGYSGKSPQDAARAIRLERLNAYAIESGADRVAVGHTADDQVETFLMRVVQGSGLTGLSGIAPASGRTIRPLIGVWREEVENYCERLGLLPRRDSSNDSDKYLRNRVRARVVPFLVEEFGPGVKEVIARECESLSVDMRFIEGEVERAFGEAASTGEGEVGLSIEILRGLDPAVARGVIRRSWSELLPGMSPPSWRHVNDVLEKVVGGQSGAGLALPCRVRAERQYEEVILLLADEETAAVVGPQTLDVPGRVLLGDGRTLEADLVETVPGKFSDDPAVELVRPDVPLPLEVRGYESGDRFFPLGAPGEIKLARFFINNKVPRGDRGRVPIVLSRGEVVWVAGIRLDERFRVRAEDREAIRLRLTGAGNMMRPVRG